jgi:outer membrane protein assembly factor BamE (lipoprotein component of BamABCDE complex)
MAGESDRPALGKDMLDRKLRHSMSALPTILGASALLLLLGACAPRVDTHGFMPNPELIEQVEPGQVSKLDVADILGSPSTIATFDNDTWYYITQKTQNFAFFKPEIVDQQVLVVNFDDQDIVSNVNRYTIEDGLIVDPVSRTTPTVGNELTFLQQLFGNIGRFAK